MKTIFATVCVLAVCAAGAAHAAGKMDCLGLAVADDRLDLTAGTITGAKVNFLANETDKPGCPSADAKCVRHAYVLNGNSVALDGETAQGKTYVCAAYMNPRGQETDGWIPAADVKPAVMPVSWLGTWQRDTTSTIKITLKKNGKLDVDGSATYGQGAATNEAELGGELDPKKRVQGYIYDPTTDTQKPYTTKDSPDCAEMLSVFGPYLYVADSGMCGGMNVNFTGLYYRK
jgi:hypothetical protein